MGCSGPRPKSRMFICFLDFWALTFQGGFSVMGQRAGACLCAFWALLVTFQGGFLSSFGFRVTDLVSH